MLPEQLAASTFAVAHGVVPVSTGRDRDDDDHDDDGDASDGESSDKVTNMMMTMTMTTCVLLTSKKRRIIQLMTNHPVWFVPVRILLEVSLT